MARGRVSDLHAARGQFADRAGGQQLLEPQIGGADHQPGDRCLICSDGLIDGLWDRQMEDIVRNCPHAPGEITAAQKLINEAVQNSGRDNTTAVVVEIPAPDPSP